MNDKNKETCAFLKASKTLEYDKILTKWASFATVEGAREKILSKRVRATRPALMQ